MMTKKIYEEAAYIVRTIRIPHEGETTESANTRGDIAEGAFALLFSRDNPRFDGKRFSAACVLGGGK